MNGDAAEHLARAKSGAARATPRRPPPTAAHEPVARFVPETASPPGGAWVMGHAREEPASPTLDVRGTPADIETFDGTVDFNAVAHSAAKADGIEVQEEVELKPQDLVVEGLAHTQFEAGFLGTPPDMAEQDDEPKIDLPLIMPDDVAEAAAAAPAFAEEELPPPFAAAQRTPAPPTPPPAAVALSDDDGPAHTPAPCGR